MIDIQRRDSILELESYFVGAEFISQKIMSKLNFIVFPSDITKIYLMWEKLNLITEYRNKP